MSERGPEPAPQPKPRRPRLLADLSPLREFRDFRFLFFGNAISYLGRQMTVVAIPFQVYVLTDSSLAVGMTGLVSLGPLVVMSLVGGAVADAVDRRKLLLVAVLAQAATAVALAVNALRATTRRCGRSTSWAPSTPASGASTSPPATPWSPAWCRGRSSPPPPR